GVHARPGDALDAVGALLHDAPHAHRDVGVLQHLEHRHVVVGEAQEVEAPHLVGAVVRAVARPHAAVVDHVVQPLVAVHRGRHRADHLAGGDLALHAGDRLVVGHGVVKAAGDVAVDAQPVHLALLQHLLLADRRDVVLRLAGDDAGAAAGTDVQVDRHRPLVALVLVGRVEARRLRLFPLGLGVDEVGIGLPLGEGAGAHRLADGGLAGGGRDLLLAALQQVVVLGAGEGEGVAGLADAGARQQPEVRRGAQRVGVGAVAGGDAAGAAAPVAQVQGGAAVGVAGLHPDGGADAAAAAGGGGDLDDVLDL